MSRCDAAAAAVVVAAAAAAAVVAAPVAVLIASVGVAVGFHAVPLVVAAVAVGVPPVLVAAAAAAAAGVVADLPVAVASMLPLLLLQISQRLCCCCCFYFIFWSHMFFFSFSFRTHAAFHPSAHNGLTMCVGSFASREDNDVVKLVEEVQRNIFVCLRSDPFLSELPGQFSASDLRFLSVFVPGGNTDFSFFFPLSPPPPSCPERGEDQLCPLEEREEGPGRRVSTVWTEFEKKNWSGLLEANRHTHTQRKQKYCD